MLYAFQEAWRSLRRNGLASFLSFLTTFIALSLLGSTFLVEVNLRHMFRTVEQGIDVQVFLKRETSQEDIDAVLKTVSALPGVSQVKYVSPEEGLEQLRTMFEDMASVLDGLESNNPLPPKIEVKTNSVSDIVPVASALKDIPAVDDVIYQKEAQEKLEAVGRLIQTSGLAGMASMGAVAVLVTANGIRLTIMARRHEVAIMKLVGATDGFITGPFFCEGLMVGFFGSVASCAFLLGMYRWLSQWLTVSFPYLPVVLMDGSLARDLFVILGTTGLAVGGLASALSLRRYLT